MTEFVAGYLKLMTETGASITIGTLLIAIMMGVLFLRVWRRERELRALGEQRLSQARQEEREFREQEIKLQEKRLQREEDRASQARQEEQELREQEIKLQEVRLRREEERELRAREEERELRAQEIKLQMEQLINQQQKDNNSSPAGPGSGGYIVVDLPDDEKPLFHDVLKGFEEYARIRGYRVHFSVDNTHADKIAFKFTVAESVVTVSTDQVKRDIQDYIQKVQSGAPLDDLPVIIPEPQHEALLLAMKNRINFLQHTYIAQQNALEVYENVMSRIKEQGFGVAPPQNFYLLGGGEMGNTSNTAIGSPQAAVGEGNLIEGNTLDQSVRIGDSAKDRMTQANLVEALVSQLRQVEPGNEEAKSNAEKYLIKVKDELLDEEKPDKKRIEKWLGQAKGYLNILEKGGEIINKTKEVFESFGLSFQ